MNITGKCSWFGGPSDTGVSPSEGLAFIYKYETAPYLFLDQQPPDTTGLARRLDPKVFYIACRWNYDIYPKDTLLKYTALVRSTKAAVECIPADWGPHVDTGRVADLSPGAMEALGIETDDVVEVIYPYKENKQEADVDGYGSIAISSGHSAKCVGAVGILDEYTEAVRVSDKVAEILRARGVTVYGAFHDMTSTTQNANLNKIVDWHNSQRRDLDVSIHFNCNVPTDRPVGTECLYVTQKDLAEKISAAIATSGLIDRGGKKRTDLFFLNQTTMPAVLVEICFVDSSADVTIYRAKFDQICAAIADVLQPQSAPEPVPPEPEVAEVTIEIKAKGKVRVTVYQSEPGA